MPRRMSPSQMRSKLRQAQQKQKRAVTKYNSAARKLNRAIGDYNREARAHNSRVRSNRQRLRRELKKLERQSSSTRFTTYRTSVQALQRTFVRVETKAASGSLGPSSGLLLDLSEREAANSVEVLNTLLAPAQGSVDAPPDLRETSLEDELADISPDLRRRWHGALFALDPQNPDAARHFCASSREILTLILEREAPDEEVFQALPECSTTQNGRPTRRAKVQFFLKRKGIDDGDLEEFVEQDLENVVTLFGLFNEGTHGSAGKFDLHQLAAIKRRVEDAIQFLYGLVR